jgi:hypothetical protein
MEVAILPEQKLVIDKWVGYNRANKGAFFVDMDDLWKLTGYSTKGNAVVRMKSRDMDAREWRSTEVECVESDGVVRSHTVYLLTLSGTYKFWMISKTPQAELLRQYLSYCVEQYENIRDAVTGGAPVDINTVDTPFGKV